MQRRSTVWARINLRIKEVAERRTDWRKVNLIVIGRNSTIDSAATRNVRKTEIFQNRFLVFEGGIKPVFGFGFWFSGTVKGAQVDRFPLRLIAFGDISWPKG